MKKSMTIAILYDFDKTLCTTDMQEYDFIKNLGYSASEFWKKSASYAEKYGMDRILSYMYVMIIECRKKGIKLTKEYLNKCGENIVLYKGVSSWFERINKYAEDLNVNLEHYIISSGTSEIVEGSPIAKYFTKIYGCNFLYDENGEAVWPATAINYTLKTQYVYRISKGVFDVSNDNDLNKKLENERERHIAYDNMIYIGDGLTDIPCMKLVKEKGGRAIALYPTHDKSHIHQLLIEDRINYACAADYSEGSGLDRYVKTIIEYMSDVNILSKKEKLQKIKILKEAQEACNEN